jgi:hypothetical protein
VSAALVARGHEVLSVRGLRVHDVHPDELTSGVWNDPRLSERIQERLAGADAVVLAAGNPDASSVHEEQLFAANAALPLVVARALADMSTRPRLVHVSSAVVQGRKAVLDASRDTDGFSAYSRSKIMGEELIQRELGSGYVVYRPPSVHAADRRVTRAIVRLAHSPLRSVASPPEAPSPQALIQNVADALAFLATTPFEPPPVVIHPWEGVTTGSLMRSLGGRDPRVVPRPLAMAAVRLLRLTARVWSGLEANVRRVEMMWFGQAQEPSWLVEAGWEPVAFEGAWEELRAQVLVDRKMSRAKGKAQ